MLLGLAEVTTAGGLMSNAANLELFLTPSSLASTIVYSVLNWLAIPFLIVQIIVGTRRNQHAVLNFIIVSRWCMADKKPFYREFWTIRRLICRAHCLIPRSRASALHKFTRMKRRWLFVSVTRAAIYYSCLFLIELSSAVRHRNFIVVAGWPSSARFGATTIRFLLFTFFVILVEIFLIFVLFWGALPQLLIVLTVGWVVFEDFLRVAAHLCTDPCANMLCNFLPIFTI